MTAIVCFNDGVLRTAAGVLEELNLKIGEDISIVSIDDTHYAKELAGGITEICIPKVEMGRQAVRLLEDKIANNNHISVSIEFNVKLMERNSVKEIKR